MHYFKRNIGDYHKKAGRLSMIEHGAYTLLLDACYDREKFPTLDEAIDWCWARSDQEVEAVKFVLQKFFQLVDGRYIQQRILEEVAEYHGKAENNKNIALERERRKRERKAPTVNESCTTGDENPDEHSTTGARVVHDLGKSVQDRTPNQEPLTNNHKPITINQEPLTTNQEPNASLPQAPVIEVPEAKLVERIFDYWKKIMNSPRSKLDDKRKKFIKNALKLKYTEAELFSAISGCAKDPWSMGQNDRRKPFNEISIIFRDAEHIDKFIRICRLPAAPSLQQKPFNPVEYMNRNQGDGNRIEPDSNTDIPGELEGGADDESTD